VLEPQAIEYANVSPAAMDQSGILQTPCSHSDTLSSRAEIPRNGLLGYQQLINIH
jgi:hypothetical protein